MNKLKLPKWLLVLFVVVLILRIPSFFEPYSYGDEMIYLTLGEAVRRGLPLYKAIHDNKPPLLYLTAAIAGNLFWFKTILAAWSIATVYIFWRFAGALYPKYPKLPIISTIVFAFFTTLPLLEGNIANSELFMIGPTILAFLIILTRPSSYKNIFIAGLLFSVAALFKIPAAFDLPAAIFLWLASIKLNKTNLLEVTKKTAVLLAGFLLPIAATLIWYAARGAFSEYLIAAYLQNFGYLSSWRPDDAQKSFLAKNAPLIIRGLIVLAGLTALYLNKKRLSANFIFLSSWVLFSLFAVTLSERPYPHYLIQTIPPASLLLGLLVIQKKYEHILTIIPLTLVFLVPVYYKFWYYPTTSYYARFYDLASGRISKEEYLSKFGGHILSRYKVSEYLVKSTTPNDKIFVWGDTATIYALSHRLPPIKYVADYHIKDFAGKGNVAKELTNKLPKFIIVTKDAEQFSELDTLLVQNYGLVETVEETQIWILLNPKVRSLIAQ